MPMTDPLGDMLTRIRNGQQARKDSILTPASKLRARVLDVLQREGYIRGYSEEALGRPEGPAHRAEIFRGPAGDPASRARLEARPPRLFGLRRSCRTSATALASRSSRRRRGVLSDAEARDQNVGGEVLAEVF